MGKKRWAILLTAGIWCTMSAMPAQADFAPEVEKAYNTAVQGQDILDGLNCRVTETTVSTKTNVASVKRIDLKVSGITQENLEGRISISSNDVDVTSDTYYTDGWYYYTLDGKKMKQQQSRDAYWRMVNSQIYLDMNSSYLQTLYSMKDDVTGNTNYVFSATDDTIGDYNEKLLDHLTAQEGNATVNTLQGSMIVDRDGHVISREITMSYTVENNGSKETFVKVSRTDYSQNGEVTVRMPADLSSYQEAQAAKPAVTFTEKSATLYATAGINVRSAGSLDGTIIGGYQAGDGMTETGYTSDGWIQIQYEGQTGYVWGEYTSHTRPVITTGASGTMYAAVNVNIREDANAQSGIIGVLYKGSGIEITGKTNTGWTRVNYKNAVGYIYSDYLSWSEPVVSSYVENASITGTVAGTALGSITLANGMSFDTAYTAWDIIDSVRAGDEITIVYSGAASPYTANKVTDRTSHVEAVLHNNDEEYAEDPDITAAEDENEEITMVVSGVVTATDGWNYVRISCDDGVVRNFEISAAEREIAELQNGVYATVTWTTADPDQTVNIIAEVIE